MTDTTEPNIPDNELGHRRRVMALGSDIADLLRDLVDRAKEYRELGVPAREWLGVVAGALPTKPARVIDWATGYIAPAIDFGLALAAGGSVDDAMNDSATANMPAFGLVEPHPEPQYLEDSNSFRMRHVIARLFAEAPKLEGQEDQAPALEVHILLRSGAPIQFSGILSTTPEGGLRLMTPTKDGNGKPCMIEQFFDYADVTSVAVVREVKATPGSRIVTPS